MRSVGAVALLLLLLLAQPCAAGRKSKAKAEAARLMQLVREHGGAGRWPQSLESSLQAIALDPSSQPLYSDLSFTLTQVAAQPAAMQQGIAGRLTAAASGGDERMPHIEALEALYSPAAPFVDRAVAVAKVGVEVGCGPGGRSGPGGFGEAAKNGDAPADLRWLGVAMDALAVEPTATPKQLGACMLALSRVAATAHEADAVATYLAGRLSLALEGKFGTPLTFPDVFNCGKAGIAVTLNGGTLHLTGAREALFYKAAVPVFLIAGDLSVDSVDSLELARYIWSGAEGAELTGAAAQLRAAARAGLEDRSLLKMRMGHKLIDAGSKMCLDRAVELGPQNLLGYLARGSLFGNLDGPSAHSASAVRSRKDASTQAICRCL